MLCYVDDILIVSDGESIERRIISAIQHRVPVKITGRALQDMSGGVSITFIGRTIRRWPNCKSIEVFVRTDYLVPCWEAYQIKKGSYLRIGISFFSCHRRNSMHMSWHVPKTTCEPTFMSSLMLLMRHTDAWGERGSLVEPCAMLDV